MNRLPLAASLLALAATASAQDLLPKAAPQTQPVLLTNATLHTVDRGVVLGGSLLFDQGVIRGIWPAGETPQLPAARTAEVIDLQGKQVFPGLLSAHSNLGLQELNMVRQTNDTDELGEFTPEALATVAVNPDSAALPVARSNGVLAAAVFPAGGLLPGRLGVIQLDGWTNADLAVRAAAGVVVGWPEQGEATGSRRRGANPVAEPRDAAATARRRLDEQFDRARAWLTARAADPQVPLDVRHEALAPALRGEVPVFLLADELEAIESAVRWATGRGLRAVVVGGRDAAGCAALLRDRQVPVVVDGVHRLPGRDDLPVDDPFTLPARLHAAGVTFCIAGGADFANQRNLPYHAATAAAHGLDAATALAAITLRPAQILGVADRLGSLTKGKDATLFVADGHPFALATAVERAWIQGRAVDLRNKQTELARKYRLRYQQQAK